MRAEIIAVGTELLLGHIVNTNAAFLSQKLAENGIDVYYQTTVGDNPARLTEALRLATSRADLVITSGGLGPTVDDITMKTVAAFIGKPLVINRSVEKFLKKFFAARKIKMPACNIQQAYQPKGVRTITNKVGTAPGLIARYHDSVIICLPGPPSEIQPMFINQVIPYLKGIIGNKAKKYDRAILKSRTIRITGLPESLVDAKVRDLLRLKPPTTVGIYAKLREVDLRIMAKAQTPRAADHAIARIERTIRKRLGAYVFGADDDTLESAVGRLLTQKRLTIAVAESCTGGLVTSRLTDCSGASEYLKASVVTYANEAKMRLLGVSESTLIHHGAVSRDVALEMAKGVIELTGSSIGLALTGIAGPAGGTRKKPVGLVYIALVAGGSRGKKIAQEFRFSGKRTEIKFQASQVALDMVRRYLIKKQ